MNDNDELSDFLERIPNRGKLSSTGLIDYFVYFLTVLKNRSSIRSSEIEFCFRSLDMHVPGVSQYLSAKSKKVKGKSVLFIHDDTGYRLERNRKTQLDNQLTVAPLKRETNKTLSDLVGALTSLSEQEFLTEAIKCYEVNSYRATVLMVWILTVDHLYEYILQHHLSAFNVELAKVTDKRVKVSIVKAKDDFSDIPEGIFINLCRASNIISNDVRKILDEKLGTRNSYAHPSTLKLSQAKSSDFVQDLVTNVILKYNV